jgi:hypothetical protein
LSDFSLEKEPYKMRSLVMGAVSTALPLLLPLLASRGAEAERRFPKSIQGNGFLALPIGAIERPPTRARRRDESAIEFVLSNKFFYYAAEGKSIIRDTTRFPTHSIHQTRAVPFQSR